MTNKYALLKLAAGALLVLAASADSSAQVIYARSGNNLISFNAATPAVVLNSVAISGITSGQTIEGMDFRPATGQLYAFGYNQSTGASQLYTINTTTGAATVVNAAPVNLQAGMGKIGFDFNPTVDRIRVTGSNNSNYRLHPVTGAIAATDMPLAFASADANAGKNPSIGALAYTNSYIGATSTTLYDYDDSLNIIATQIPPNNGTLNTIGSSGITVNTNDPTADMDIYFNPATSANVAYLAANTGVLANDNLYTVNLTTGAATLVGIIGSGVAVQDIAVLIDRTVPSAVSGRLVYGLTSNNNLISFDSDTSEIIRSSAAVTGVTAGQTLAGMDFRPATGELIGLGYNSTNGESQLYVIAPATGVATAINSTPFTLQLGTGDIGFDFNPTVDRIRVVGANNANYRLNPVTGAIAATDMNLNFVAGDANAGANPAIGAVAYTNSFKGSTMTVLYDYDDSLNVIARQDPPNDGKLNTVGSSGITVNPADPSVDFDIYFVPSLVTPNIGLLSANTGSSLSDNLYTLDLLTGGTTLEGKIGYGIAVRDIAAYLDTNNVTGITAAVQSSADSRVYPNPASAGIAHIAFQVKEQANVKVSIVDAMGRTIEAILDRTLVQGLYEADWNTEGLAKGIYFVRIDMDNTAPQVVKVLVK
jgi:trimeric autotransporter adhesin